MTTLKSALRGTIKSSWRNEFDQSILYSCMELSQGTPLYTQYTLTKASCTQKEVKFVAG
jgi:hypothetical protein